MEDGKSALHTIESLITPDLPKQKIGVASLLELYAQLESSYVSVKSLGSSASLTWEAFHQHQMFRECLVALRDQASDVLSTMDDFKASTPSMSIYLSADLLDPAIQILSLNYKKRCEGIKATGAD